jgi:hypothetical protein
MVPEKFAKVFTDVYNIKTAADLFAILITYPGGVASALHWDVSDVVRATDKLRTQLRGLVDEKILNPQPPSASRVYGARNPSEH